MSASGYTAQLERKRATVARRLSHSGQTCAVRRPVTTLSDNGRPQNVAPSVVAANVPCLLTRQRIQTNANEPVVAGEIRAVSEYVLILPHDIDVRAEDHIELPDGRIFEIVAGAGTQTTNVSQELTVVEFNPGHHPAGVQAAAGFSFGVDGEGGTA